jgi:hypothetical protein
LTLRFFSLPWAYGILAVLSLVALGGHFFLPAFFFPGWSPILARGLFLVLAAGSLGRLYFRRLSRNKKREMGLGFLRQAIEKRDLSRALSGPGAGTAERTLTRLVQNADADLSEIRPDFSQASLERLAGLLPELLEEIQNETDALIRWGIVGVYLGETACRQWGWRWNFRADPALRQFDYLVSGLERAGGQADPFDLATRLMLNQIKTRELVERLKGGKS